MHALIIDDDKDSLTVLSRILSMEGISSTTVKMLSTLQRVLADETAIDIVFLDLEMPESTGYAVFENLKANPRFEGVPIVAYTVHISEMSNVRQLGFDSFIGKPINADLFPGQLRQILGGTAVWQI